MTRVPIYLQQSLICASFDAKVSPANSRRLSRQDFGGTNPGDPDISTTEITGIDFVMSTNSLGLVNEGHYQRSKESPAHDGHWYQIKDHVYEDDEHGYLLAVNAAWTAGRFYTGTMDNVGACHNLNMVFSGWFASAVDYNAKDKAGVVFRVTDSNTGKVLSEFTSGNLIDMESRWQQYGFQFPVPPGVDNITFTVSNSNYGSGGNDLFMDDIEVYLAIPPVTLIPPTDDYVYVDDINSIAGTALLQGIYTDDGTLGANLDYRWEFSTDKINWISLGAQDAGGNPIPAGYGSVTTGVVSQDQSTYTINDFKPENTGWYRLIVGQSGALTGTVNYDCLAWSSSRKLTYAGRTRFCMDSSQDFTVFLSDDTITYSKWDFGDGKPEITNTNVASGEQIQNYTYTKSGTFLVTVSSYDAADNLIKQESFKVNVMPCVLPVNPNIHMYGSSATPN